MSHSGPRGPSANGRRFTEVFNDTFWTAECNKDRMMKFLVITYGTKGDEAAIADLNLLANKHPNMVQIKSVRARELSPETLAACERDGWIITINDEYCHYRGAVTLYDCTGKCVGHRGQYGDCDYAGRVQQTRVMYQHDLAKIKIYREEDTPVEYLPDLMRNGAFFDIPDEIHVISSEDTNYRLACWHLYQQASRAYCQIGNVNTKLVSYKDTLLTNQCSNKHIVYIGYDQTRDEHDFVFNKLKDRRIARGEFPGTYEWSDQPARIAVLGGTPLGGFHRGSMNLIAAISHAAKSHIVTLDEPAHFGWTPPLRSGKGPKGPITMPGLGDRRKKGKNKRYE